MDKTAHKPVHEKLELVVPTEQQKRPAQPFMGPCHRARAFVLLVYIGTLAKMGAGVFMRPI